ncbi:hypothetical protein [Roseobacter sp.]|uniref:hypothetical protein n=1 Tax=Roseobacter sp. TaxID=1907202 RepID=UPI002966398F|nr:hypothetical protein [Roseobacter sp.]MDW3181753.1 hypothetical protein [Roseobacter sp.]
MVSQSIALEMERLEQLATKADARREMLREVELFLEELNQSGRARATGSLFEDTIDIRICLVTPAAVDQADPAPQLNITPLEDPSVAADAGPAAEAVAPITEPPADEPEARVDVPTSAPPEGGQAVAAVPAEIKPAPVVPAAKQARVAKKKPMRTWSTEKELKLARLKLSGAALAEIAEALSVSKKAVQVRWQKIKNREDVLALGVAPTRPAAQAPEEPKAPEPAEIEVPSHRGADGFPKWVQAMIGLDYEIAAHLVQLPEDVCFPPAADLELATHLARGDGAAAAADALGLEKPLVLRRWRQINTNPTSIDHQTRLLRILRVRAETACMPA